METLSAFQARTNAFIWDSFPQDGALVTNPNLEGKVRFDGTFAPFFGNTVVYPLPAETQTKLGALRDALYGAFTDVLAEPLTTDSFHITLHDLLSGPPSEALKKQVAKIQGHATACVERLAGRDGDVRLCSTALFNMVNTSLVLGFAPADEESCRKLMEGYETLQGVVPLGYPLTPHVTLAYFRSGTVGKEQVIGLRRLAEELQRDRIEVTLPDKTLEYQIFFNMNHYETADTTLKKSRQIPIYTDGAT